jgi:hypothetical protein
MSEPTRLDRLEALAVTFLLAIQQQKEQQDHDRQEFRESISDVVSMVGSLAQHMDTMQSQMTEMQSEIRGLQLENRRMLDAFFNQQNN